MTNASLPGEIEDLPPSAKYVYYVIERKGAMTQIEIAAETGLPQPTVSQSVDRLEEEGVARRRPDPTRLRSNVVEIA